jgi:hypothetical protein
MLSEFVHCPPLSVFPRYTLSPKVARLTGFSPLRMRRAVKESFGGVSLVTLLIDLLQVG